MAKRGHRLAVSLLALCLLLAGCGQAADPGALSGDYARFSCPLFTFEVPADWKQIGEVESGYIYEAQYGTDQNARELRPALSITYFTEEYYETDAALWSGFDEHMESYFRRLPEGSYARSTEEIGGQTAEVFRISDDTMERWYYFCRTPEGYGFETTFWFPADDTEHYETVIGHFFESIEFAGQILP